MSATLSVSPSERRALVVRGLRIAAVVTLAIGLALFVSAGTLRWPAGWVFLVFYTTDFTFWVIWGTRNKPDLLKERAQSLKGGGKAWDKVIVLLNMIVGIIGFVVAGLDAVRYQWSVVTPPWRIAGVVLIVLCYFLSYQAVLNNPFASGIVRIQEDRGHHVISRGPYQYVRHPMYIGSILGDFGIPLFLGSYWALIPGVIMAALFTYRTAREDKTLREELPGYEEYTRKVRYRLVPGIW
jgi:protein-S-isoprenylcysteine O-methyltransferase Ste14